MNVGNQQHSVGNLDTFLAEFSNALMDVKKSGFKIDNCGYSL